MRRKYISGRLPVFIASIAFTFELTAAVLLPHPWFSLHLIITFLVVFAGSLFLFNSRRSLPPGFHLGPISYPFAMLHALAFVFGTTLYVYLARHTVDLVTTVPAGVVFLWEALLVLLVCSAVGTVIPFVTLWQILRSHRSQILLAAATAVAVAAARSLLFKAWANQSRLGYPLQIATFRCVQHLLGIFYLGVVSDPRNTTIGTQRFQVEIANGCSGIEGIALILTLSFVWLFLLRRELILHRAIWLVPLALIAIWSLNIVRITALIAIGDSGHPDMAVRGFHSQAGWISFNLVGIALLTAAQRLTGLRLQAASSDRVDSRALGSNVAAVYLLPFLAIVAASLFSQALSSGFEKLYPLRCLTALFFVWLYRRHYRRLDWRTSWFGPVSGIFVIAVWIAYAHSPWTHVDMQSAIPAGLSALSPQERDVWLGIRVLTAVAVVPVAEELAFRGYLARAFVSADVDQVSFRSLDLKAILISSVLFGIMHGHLWPVGIFAGIVFSLAARRSNRIGDAVASHATANLLLAVWVFTSGEYALW